MATKKKKAEQKNDKTTDLLEAMQHVSDEKGIPVEQLVSSIEGALLSAYKKAYGGTGTVRVVANFETNDFDVFAQKRVVQQALNPNTEISWRDAREKSEEVNLGDTMEEEVTPAGFGRIAAQTAKQVLLQKLREVERNQVASEYSERVGEMFRGRVERIDRGDVIVSIGKAETSLQRREQVPGESYRFGDTLFVYVVDVLQYSRGPAIVVSRTHPGLVRQLFTLEVPEIADEIVEIKNVAREAGQRTKIAVAANNPDVDPVGACVGPRGMRVGRVVDELGNEKVDIVRWDADPIRYISNALSPAQIAKVILAENKNTRTELQGAQVQDEDGDERGPAVLGTATVIVTEDQQSLAIGKQGQNVRLAAKLTRWRIDIRTEKQFAEEQARKMFETQDEEPVHVSVSRDAHDDIFSTKEESTPAQSSTPDETIEETAAPVNDIEIIGAAPELAVVPDAQVAENHGGEGEAIGAPEVETAEL